VFADTIAINLFKEVFITNDLKAGPINYIGVIIIIIIIIKATKKCTNCPSAK
jgi:hypothetical protein